MSVSYASKDGIGYITLERPEKLNALNDQMTIGIREAVFQFDDDPSAKVAIVSGQGRAFSSGADVIEKQLRPDEELKRYGGPSARGALIQEALHGVTNWKPIVAAAHGYVMGAALRLALHCDVIVAAESTQFQVTEAVRGLDAASYWLLLSDRGAGGFANDVCTTGRFWTASEGFQHGIVNRVCDDGRHMETAEEVAREIGSRPQQSVRSVIRSRRAKVAATEQLAKWTKDPTLHLSEDFRKSARDFAAKNKTGS